MYVKECKADVAQRQVSMDEVQCRDRHGAPGVLESARLHTSIQGQVKPVQICGLEGTKCSLEEVWCIGNLQFYQSYQTKRHTERRGV